MFSDLCPLGVQSPVVEELTVGGEHAGVELGVFLTEQTMSDVTMVRSSAIIVLHSDRIILGQVSPGVGADSLPQSHGVKPGVGAGAVSDAGQSAVDRVDGVIGRVSLT